MKDYKKMSCVYCGEPFEENSDIVVCPECGAPHHRECWNETGHCACEEMHSEDYEWEPEKMYIGDIKIPPDDNSDSSSVDQGELIKCPRCGKDTRKSQKYCEFCGYYIFEEEDPFAEKDPITDLEALFPFDPAEKIQGVPAGDIKRFVGNMWIYYIPRFLKMSRSRSPVSFNFTAFFTHGFWFVSRRMYLPGIMMILSVMASSLYQAYFASVMENLSGNRLAIGSMISMILSALEIVIMIISGLFGNRFYMNFCTKKIKKINASVAAEKGETDDFNRELEEKGGLTMLPAFSMVLCYLAIMYITEKGILF